MPALAPRDVFQGPMGHAVLRPMVGMLQMHSAYDGRLDYPPPGPSSTVYRLYVCLLLKMALWEREGGPRCGLCAHWLGMLLVALVYCMSVDFLIQ